MTNKMIRPSEGRDYENTELNLALNNGERINLVSHPDSKQITRDAGVLSSVLQVPLEDYRVAKPA